jgi:endonuclease/exonuclease/phosphatase family metal-dependent hydrolase
MKTPLALALVAFVSATISLATVGAFAAPGNPASTLRVMSYNLRYGSARDGENRWELRKAMLFQTIRDFGPDLLGVQEAEAGQVDELSEQLKGYAHEGVGRDDGKRKGEYSALFYKADRFEKLDGGTFWLSPTPEQVGSKGWDAALPRVATWVRLRDKSAGADAKPLLYVNTHWDHMGKTARLESAKLIRKKIPELNRDGGPVIVTGDFNTTEDDAPYKAMVQAVGAGDEAGGGPKLIDSFREVHPERQAEEASFHAFKGGTNGSRIDYILHTPELKATAAEIVRTHEGNRYPSDHYPVTAVLTRAAGAAK